MPPPYISAGHIGFCDATSNREYAAVVYMRLESESCVDVKFITAKTRVTPVSGMTIPRLELLSLAAVQVDHKRNYSIGKGGIAKGPRAFL